MINFITLTLLFQMPVNMLAERGLPISQIGEVETIAIVKPEALLARTVVTNDSNGTLPSKLYLQFHRMRVLSSNNMAQNSSVVIASLSRPADEPSFEANLLVIGRRSLNGTFRIPFFHRTEKRGEQLPPPTFIEFQSDFGDGIFAYGILPTNEEELVSASSYPLQIQLNFMQIAKMTPDLVEDIGRSINGVYNPLNKGEVVSNAPVEPDELRNRMLEFSEHIEGPYRAAFIGLLVKKQIRGSARPFLRALFEYPQSRLETSYDLEYDLMSGNLSRAELQTFSKSIAMGATSHNVLAQSLKYLNKVPEQDLRALAKWLDSEERTPKITVVRWLNKHYGGKGVTGWEAPDLDEAVAYWKGVLGR